MKRKKLFIFMLSVTLLLVFSMDIMAADHPIAVRVQNKAVPPGGSWFQPLNSPTNYIPLFSQHKTTYTIDNKSKADVTINSIKLVPGEGGRPEEFTTHNYEDLKNPIIDVKDKVIPAGKNWSFIIKFYPVHGSDRSAKVVITYNGGKKYEYTVKGKGRPKQTKFSENVNVDWAYSIGGNTTDELPSGMVLDEKENFYFSGNVAQIINVFNHDIFVGRVNNDGKLAWMFGWSGKNQDYQRDSGQNAETGGGAESIAYDQGHIYLAISHSPSKSNSTFYSVIVKIKADTGAVVWQKAWGKLKDFKIAKESTEPYSVDVKGDLVYVAGVAEGNAKVLFLTLNKATGAVVGQSAIDVAKGTNDRGYTVCADGKNGAYIGGLTSGKGLLIHLSAANTAKPKLTWVKKISMGIGSNINGLDVDSDGNAYLSCDRRGASTAFTAMRVNRDGKIAWSKMYGKRSGGKNNTHVVRVFGEHVYVGGRAGVGWHDTQFGDGVILRLKKQTGDLDWASFYYGGKGAEEMAEHRLKGIVLSPKGNLFIGGQVYTNPNNHEHFWGYWYDGQAKLKDYKGYSLSDLTKTSKLDPIPTEFGVQDAGKLTSFNQYVNLVRKEPLGKKLGVMTYQTLMENEGNGPDGDVFVMKVKVK